MEKSVLDYLKLIIPCIANQDDTVDKFGFARADPLGRYPDFIVEMCSSSSSLVMS